MDDDLTARLIHELDLGLAEDLNEWGVPTQVRHSIAKVLAARLAEVVRGHLVEHPTQDPYFDHLTTELALKERALKACQQYTDRIASERDEAVRLLEAVEPILRPHLLGGSSDFRSLNRWLRDRDAFLARHKEAQGAG